MPEPVREAPESVLTERRRLLDSIDDHLAAVLGQRIVVARAVVDEKRADGIPITDLAREEAIVDRVAGLGISGELAEAVWGAIFREVKGGG